MARSLAVARPNIRRITLTSVIAVFAAVALPQAFHVAGTLLGLGPILGETFLPMHVPVLVAGLFAGPAAGLLVGVLSPLASFALTGMPTTAMLPVLIVELATYGVVAGMFHGTRVPVMASVLLTQVAGRVVKAAVLLATIHGPAAQPSSLPQILHSMAASWPGVWLQWVLVPVALFWIEGRRDDSQ